MYRCTLNGIPNTCTAFVAYYANYENPNNAFVKCKVLAPWGASALRVRVRGLWVRVIGAKVVALGLKLGLGAMMHEGVFRYIFQLWSR